MRHCGCRAGNAVQAAGIITDNRPGARVIKGGAEAQDGAGDIEALVDQLGQGSEDVEGAGQGGDDD